MLMVMPGPNAYTKVAKQEEVFREAPPTDLAEPDWVAVRPLPHWELGDLS